jgi:hypothetical protein
LRGGYPDKAARMISERLHRRPSARDRTWLQQANSPR